jgi:virginiamycin B lyase
MTTEPSGETGEAREARETGAMMPTGQLTPTPARRPPQRQLRRLILEVVLGIAAIIGLWRLGGVPQSSGGQSRSGASPPAPHAVVRNIPVRPYRLPQPDAGPALLSVDGAGNLWFGELKANKLARLETRSGHVQEWLPPEGRNNLYTTAVGADGSIWFTEQESDYLGRFNPTTEQFTRYPLGAAPEGKGLSAGPQAVAVDGSGMVWFTEVNAGRIGRLDPRAGTLQRWDVPQRPQRLASGTSDGSSSSPNRTMPFDLALAADGGVWFGELAGGALGRLDPTTGHIALFPLADATAQVFAVALDGHGRVWFTDLAAGMLGVLDPATGRIRTIPVPDLLGNPAGLYDLLVAPDGAVWCASVGANALVRYQPDQDTFTLYALPTPESTPYGLALDRSGTLWFTADAPTAQYIGALARVDYS